MLPIVDAPVLNEMDVTVKPILQPTDFTIDAEQGFQIACGIARDQSAEVIVLHVVRPDMVDDGDGDGDELDRDSDLYQSLWSRFERLRVHAGGVATSLRVKVGHIAETIARVADEEECGLIVLAAHNRTFIEFQLQGSVSVNVERRSPVPVLCLRQSPFHHEPETIGEALRREFQPTPL